MTVHLLGCASPCQRLREGRARPSYEEGDEVQSAQVRRLNEHWVLAEGYAQVGEREGHVAHVGAHEIREGPRRRREQRGEPRRGGVSAPTVDG